MNQMVRFPKKYSKHVMLTKFLYKMHYNVSPCNNKNFYSFHLNKLCITKYLREQLFIPITDNHVVVARWLLFIHSRNMAKSAIHNYWQKFSTASRN